MLIAAFTLAGCSSGTDSADASQQDDNVSFQIPDSLLGNKVDRNNLSATISVNGGTPQAMAIDDGSDSATVSLSNIPTGDTTFVITFTYDFGGTPLTVAEATKNFTVAEGANNINFIAADYDTSFDEDGDGISNIAELDETSTSDPTVETCRIGTDVTDSSILNDPAECELG
jgi:hypothetical protein